MLTFSAPELLALDFDGVLCDGLREYFQTAWRAYCQIWLPAELEPPTGLAERFYRLRPVIETGWEMPVLLRALVSGTADAAVLAEWPTIARQIVMRDTLDPGELASIVDGTRDAWIQADLPGWLAQHQFFPGTIAWLKTLAPERWVIVTTKESRFVRQLLSDRNIDIASDRLFGKEVGRPKYETLELLQTRTRHLWFVEDRLPALQAVTTRPALAKTRLFLAEWGYTTATHRQVALASDRVQLLSLAAFVSDFSQWPAQPHSARSDSDAI